MQPQVWDSLKLALKTGEIVIDTLSEHAVTNSTIITPKAIPLNVKVVLLGSRDLYYLVQDVDDEFNELFRVLADFEAYLPYTPANFAIYVVAAARSNSAARRRLR